MKTFWSVASVLFIILSALYGAVTRSLSPDFSVYLVLVAITYALLAIAYKE